MVERQAVAVIRDFGTLSFKIGVPFETVEKAEDADKFTYEEEIECEEKNTENLVIKAINNGFDLE